MTGSNLKVSVDTNWWTLVVGILIVGLSNGGSSKEVPGATPFDKSNLAKGGFPSEAYNSSCVVGGSFGCLKEESVAAMKGKCPDVQSKIWKNYFPQGRKAAGTYTEMTSNITEMDDCAKSCCLNENCHYAFVVNSTCYLLNCNYGEYLCLPMQSSEFGEGSNFSMTLIRTPRPSNFTGITCEVGLDTDCKMHQKCIPTGHHSRNGVCVCADNYVLDETLQQCLDEKFFTSSTTSSPPPAPLSVSVKSKNITLNQETEVSLVAYVVPQAPADHPYSYNWALISNPDSDTANVEGQTTDTLRLSGFKEGTYIFQVTATSTSTTSNGSANATILVLAEKKPNQAPVVVISPSEQSIQLPTSSAVLDASLSYDDDKIISYKWELQKGPILFKTFKSLNSSTLQVENLIPGNYTFKLTVEDSEHATNTTTANITVIKEPEYPPSANPGGDVVIYLPQTEVVLNGNASTDDKKIVEWEWKATGDQQKAIDMQNTHTPYLKLSHLQVGLYQFELKVTDETGQSSAATVHVVVKEATGSPPIADAGTDQQTILNKQNWIILDGSKSKSESNKITKYIWTQIHGPNNATILLIDDGIRVNVSGLTKGDYEFLLIVEDETKLRGNSTVKVTVIQKINEAPRAFAGGNVQVKLPLTIAQLDGSSSTDDVKIVSWLWTRQPDSLAAGIILKNSDSSPILQLTDLVPGKYIFKLTVKDEQGLSSDDSATLIVEKETNQSDLIEVILGVTLTQFTESDKNQVIQQFSLLVPYATLKCHSIHPQLHSGNVILKIHGEDNTGVVINGSSLVFQLRKRLYQDAALLRFPVYSVDTVLCLDTCSGHGLCQDTFDGRACACSAFWMENFVKKRYGNGERNCEWSKIYVGVVVGLLLIVISALAWSLSFMFQWKWKTIHGNLGNGSSSSPSRSNGKRYHSNKKQYTLLDDEEIELRAQEDDEAESEDSDSDILFENSRKSKNGSAVLHPLTNGVRNGILKNPRRAKT